MKKILQKLYLNPENSIVIGSGILQALGIRKSKDIDIVVSQETYDLLKESEGLTVSINHGHEILGNHLLEIGTSWSVLDKAYTFKDLINDSLIIDGVRYITLNFLYQVKRSWISGGQARPKDVEDIRLIEAYKESK